MSFICICIRTVPRLIMKTTTPLLLAAGTQSKALVFWTRPHGHDAAQEPVLLIRLCDLILLMHGDHVFDFAEDMYNLAVETGTQFYITTEKEAICQKASDACFEPLPLPARYSMSLYLQLFFPYQDCVLLLLQIHYHKMACSLKMKAGRMDASSMYMSRLQLLDRAKKQFTLEFGGASNKSLVAFDRLEFRTTQLLQSLYGVEEGPLMDRLQNPNMIADRAKYIRASHHILKNLTQQDLLYVNMVTVLDPTRMEKTWATTFLAAMIEGYYVYYGTKKNLHLSSVQQAAQEQFRQLIGGVQTKVKQFFLYSKIRWIDHHTEHTHSLATTKRLFPRKRGLDEKGMIKRRCRAMQASSCRKKIWRTQRPRNPSRRNPFRKCHTMTSCCTMTMSQLIMNLMFGVASKSVLVMSNSASMLLPRTFAVSTKRTLQHIMVKRRKNKALNKKKKCGSIYSHRVLILRLPLKR